MATLWTKEKEDVILAEVNKTPEHLRDAFKRASEIIGKTPDAVCTRFYGEMNNKTKSATETNPDLNPYSPTANWVKH